MVKPMCFTTSRHAFAHRDVFSRILVLEQAPLLERDPDLLEVGRLSPCSLTSENASSPAAPESSRVLCRLI